MSTQAKSTIDPDWIDFLESRVAHLELRLTEIERILALKAQPDPY